MNLWSDSEELFLCSYSLCQLGMELPYVEVVYHLVPNAVAIQWGSASVALQEHLIGQCVLQGAGLEEPLV